MAALASAAAYLNAYHKRIGMWHGRRKRGGNGSVACMAPRSEAYWYRASSGGSIFGNSMA